MMLFLRQATKHLQMSPSIYINIVNESEKYQELYDYLNNNKKKSPVIYVQLSMFSFCRGLCKILDLFCGLFGSQIRFNV